MADSSGDTAAPTPPPKASQHRRERPDPRSSRLMIGVGAMAALTVIGAGLVRFPVTATETAAAAPNDGKTPRTAKADRPVRYIKLKRGQKAPKGAKVIQKAAPPPRIVVRYVMGSGRSTASSGSTAPIRSTSKATKVRRQVVRRPVTKTKQSG